MSKDKPLAPEEIADDNARFDNLLENFDKSLKQNSADLKRLPPAKTDSYADFLYEATIAKSQLEKVKNSETVGDDISTDDQLPDQLSQDLPEKLSEVSFLDLVYEFLLLNDCSSSLHSLKKEMSKKSSDHIVQTQSMKYLSSNTSISKLLSNTNELHANLNTTISSLEKTTVERDETRSKMRVAKKDKDYYAFHYRRVECENRLLHRDLNRIKKFCEEYDPLILELRRKYEGVVRDKGLLKIERDKYAKLYRGLKETQNLTIDSTMGTSPIKSPTSKSPVKSLNKTIPMTSFKKDETITTNNIYSVDTSFDTENVHYEFTSNKAFSISLDNSVQIQTESLLDKLPGISAIDRINDNVYSIGKDNGDWCLVSLEEDPKMACAVDRAHQDFISSTVFSPHCSKIFSTGGDGVINTISLVDLNISQLIQVHPSSSICPIWDIKLNSSGTTIATASNDGICRFYDLGDNHDCISKQSTSLRNQHVDAINSFTFAHFSDAICFTASADGTVVQWDRRTSTPCHTMILDACANFVVNNQYNDKYILSGNSDGTCFLFDCRKLPNALLQLNCGNYSVSQGCFTSSREFLVSSDDSSIKVFSTDNFIENVMYNIDSILDAIVDFDMSSPNSGLVGCSNGVLCPIVKIG